MTEPDDQDVEDAATRLVFLPKEKLKLILEKPYGLEVQEWCNVRLANGLPAFPASRWWQ